MYFSTGKTTQEIIGKIAWNNESIVRLMIENFMCTATLMFPWAMLTK